MKNISKFLALTLAGSMIFLCGCTEIDMQQIDQLTSNVDAISADVNTISEKVGDFSKIEGDIAGVEESIADLEEVTASTAVLVDELQANFQQIPLDEIDIDSIAAAYDDSAIGTVMNLDENAMAALDAAEAKYNEGMQQYMDSYDALAALDLTDGTVKHGIHEVYYYTEEMVDGLNTASEGLAILITRFSGMGSDAIEVAEMFGLEETDEISQLKNVLDEASEGVSIYIMGPDTHEIFDKAETELVDELSDTSRIDNIDADPVIDEIFDEITPLAENVEELNDIASDYYETYNPAARMVLEEIKYSGVVDKNVSDTLDVISDYLEENPEQDFLPDGVEGEDLVEIAELGRDTVKSFFDQLKEAAKKELKYQMEIE